MSEYRIRATGELRTQGEVRKIHSNTSLPRVWDSNVCDALGIDPVFETPKPETTGHTQAIRNGVTQDANGNWVQAWIVVDMFSDYTNEEGTLVTKTDQENDYQARLNNEAATSVRTQRDTLLSECDWVTVKAVDQNAQHSLGIQVPQVWLDYRQALRDITSHANFPYLQDTDWPVKP